MDIFRIFHRVSKTEGRKTELLINIVMVWCFVLLCVLFYALMLKELHRQCRCATSYRYIVVDEAPLFNKNNWNL